MVGMWSAGRARRARVAILAGVVLVGGAACSADAEGSAEPTSTTAPETTSTTAAGGSSTTAAPAPATTLRPSPAQLPLTIPHSTDGTSPDADGCDVPDGAPLPDGLWFGTVTVSDGAPVVDLACFYTAEAANAAAAEDPAAVSPTPNGYYILDQGTATYAMVLNEDTLTLALDGGGTSTTYLAPAPGVAAVQAAVEASTIAFRGWVLVLDGVVTVVQQQYLP